MTLKQKLWKLAAEGDHTKEIVSLLTGLSMLRESLFTLSPGVIDFSALEAEVQKALVRLEE